MILVGKYLQGGFSKEVDRCILATKRKHPGRLQVAKKRLSAFSFLLFFSFLWADKHSFLVRTKRSSFLFENYLHSS